MVLLPKNARTTEPVVGVHAHVLPVSDDCVVVVAVSVSDAVAGAQETLPRSNMRFTAFAQSVETVAENVPLCSVPPTIDPDAVAVAAPKVVPVPDSFARAWW